MCGILFHRFVRERPQDAVYERALELMKERGPDHRALSMEEGFVAGHTRLAIIDLHAEANQPFWSTDRRKVLVFNGEIYNYKELRAQLQAQGVSFQTRSDTEVLLHAIETWGLEAALPRLRGMFAFALHDTHTRKTLVARDHFGQKPLYYADGSGSLALASDPLAVATLIGCQEPDLDSYDLYLSTAGNTGTRGLHAPDRSFFRGVKMLPAGHWMEVGADGEAQIRCYFQVGELFDETRYHQLSNAPREALLEELSGLIDQSMRRHLVSDVPSGVFLSGGIDSSSVFWSAMEYNDQIQTFTKVSPGIENIPLEVVPELLRRRPATAHFIRQDKGNFVADLKEFIAYSRAPSRWNSGPSMYSLCESARKNGVLTLLGGDCVDEYFGGYIHYKSYLDRCPSDTDLGDLVGLDKADTAVARAYLERQNAIRGDILKRLSCVSDPRDRLAHATMLHDTATFLQTCTLPHSDAYSMMASVELRNPMLDLDLVRFSVNLPAHLRTAEHPNGEFGKVLFRELAEQRIGSFTNIRKEGTRNYAMSIADPAMWQLERLAIAQQFALPDTPTPRQMIRMINLEMFHNVFFGPADWSPADLLSPAGRDM